MKPIIRAMVAIAAFEWTVACMAAGLTNADATTSPKAGAVEADSRPMEFRFNGGSFEALVSEMRAYYGTNDLQLLQIPRNAWELRVPKMRIPDASRTQNAEGGPAAARTLDLRGALFAYNQISESGDWFLGKWIFNSSAQPGPPPPFKAIVFMPPKTAGNDANEYMVRAFPVRRVSEDDKKRLVEMLEEEAHRLRDDLLRSGRNSALAEGQSRIHSSTELLVAKGGKLYIELVSALVDAFLSNSTNAAKPPVH